MVNFLDLKKRLAESFWGFSPNRDVKPVHFANGFFRAIAGHRGNINLLQKAAAGFRSGRGLPNEQFIPLLRESYIEQGEDLDINSEVVNLRTALDLVLDQDKALFANFNSSITLTHYLHTSGDPSDNGTGDFLARTLAASPEITETLRRVLSKRNDNVVLLTGPLLEEAQLGEPPLCNDATRQIIERSPHLKSIQTAFSRLMKYESQLEKTVFLQRVIILGCFALYIHLTNSRISQSDSERGFVPILITGINPSQEIREASRSTFARGRQQIESGFEEALRAELLNRGQLGKTKEEYLRLMRASLPIASEEQSEKKRKQAEQLWTRFEEDFQGNLYGTEDVSEAFIKAWVRAAFSADRSPEVFAQYLGKSIGLLYPREGGKGEKYFLPGSQFLDTLVVALLEPEEELTYEQFWERAWKELGIICGAKSTVDVGRLTKWGIMQATTKQLSQNSKRLKMSCLKWATFMNMQMTLL
ncbi:hypothetical protein N6H14_14740 [Paenibacillus sp. CC-CFT747]|nr:hypothetical protein N6H14_14740 [Paenibacillus sp. CC-CFT747]